MSKYQRESDISMQAEHKCGIQACTPDIRMFSYFLLSNNAETNLINTMYKPTNIVLCCAEAVHQKH